MEKHTPALVGRIVDRAAFIVSPSDYMDIPKKKADYMDNPRLTMSPAPVGPRVSTASPTRGMGDSSRALWSLVFEISIVRKKIDSSKYPY